jgi:ABC-type sugar transport system ATPase subunit
LVRSAALLEVEHAAKSFDGVTVLHGVSLSVLGGEVHALMGENGAGKSTLIKLLAGVLDADRLDLTVRRAPAFVRGPADAQRLGFRFIHQELNLVAGLSVAENIFLGHPYPKTSLGTVNWSELAKRAQGTLERLGIKHIAPRQTAGRLSVGDAMLVSVARAFAGEAGTTRQAARLYVMDEPTAALSRAETELLFAVIRGLKAQGSSVIYVSHRLDEIFEISDRITVMRDGQVVATTATRDAVPAELIGQMTGHPPAEAYPSRTLTPSPTPVLKLTGASNIDLKEISFTLFGGEVVGVAGLAGAGRSELLRALAGADPLHAGTLELYANRVQLGAPGRAWRHGVAFVPEERRTQGLVMNASVHDNTVLPHLGALSRLGFTDRKRERVLANRVTNDVRLKARSLDQRVHSLSGGNQQKVVLARALAARPKVLLLDEPTRGVDVGAKRDIYNLILEAAAGGAAVLMASSDLPELLNLCSRVLVLQNGHLSHEAPTQGLSQADLLTLCYPLEAA